MTRSLAVLSLSLLGACGANVAPILDARVSDAASADVSTDITRADGSADVVALDVPRFERCPRGAHAASAVGASTLGRFDYRFAWAGFESFGSHSCPKLVVRFAPVDDVDSPDHLDFTVSFRNDMRDAVLGERAATIEHFVAERSVTIMSNVTVVRADGLTPRTGASELFSSLRASVHTALWDVDATVIDAPECSTFFSICL